MVFGCARLFRFLLNTNYYEEKKNANEKNKFMATLIALLLLLSMDILLCTLPHSSAHTPPWQIPVTAYLTVTPNPIGLGKLQQLSCGMTGPCKAVT